MSKYFLIIIIFSFKTLVIFSQATNLPVRNGITFSPRWIDNLLFLNSFDEPLPAEKQMLYKWAETSLVLNDNQGFSYLSKYKAFQDHCEEYNIVHLGGPMLGNITSSSVDIWIRTIKSDKVSVQIKTGEETLTFGPVESTDATELSAIVHVSGLKPDSRYHYEIIIGDKHIDIPDNAYIHTLPVSQDIDTRIVFGSCFHRWGLGNEKQSKTMESRNPHAFLAIGDIAAQDKMNSTGWHSLDFLARDLYPAWQNIVSKIPVYSLWDDHDYFGNDLWGIPKGFTNADREKVWKVFRYSWNNPFYGFGYEGKGVFFRTRIGPCDVITVDHRYFRTRESFLGNEQMQWLEKQLLDCKGPFIILACGSMWSDYVSEGKDSWGEFDPNARESIFNLIENKNIAGVLLISGDRHGARGFRIPRPSGFNFYEFEVASLGGITGPPEKMEKWTTQFYGINGKYAFGEFTFNTAKKDPEVTFRLIGEDGNFFHEMTLKRSELTPRNFIKK
jgi:alkaline phosphatase D